MAHELYIHYITHPGGDSCPCLMGIIEDSPDILSRNDGPPVDLLVTFGTECNRLCTVAPSAFAC
jgi:hypothetical protein